MNQKVTRRAFLNNSYFGGDEPFFLIAGPCVMEDKDLIDKVA
ncbi:MAG: 3-deoxy-8-phosphooctulonate synthase, partial [Spirochaetia bacterium]|nr:3-deoxy-8-phosphooctulonate synthase [Spirochaetia bacterium]